MISKKLQKKLHSTRPSQPRVYPADVLTIDALLDGGLSSGQSVEWLGQRSSGKTAVLRTLVENIRHQGISVAWVDAKKTLMAADWRDDLPGRMWVLRPPTPEDAIFCTEAMLRAQSFGVVIMDSAPRLKGNLALRLRRLARQSGTTLITLLSSESMGHSNHAHLRLHFRSSVQPARDHLARRQPFTWQIKATRIRTASPAFEQSLEFIEHLSDRLLSEAIPADRPATRSAQGHRYTR